MIINSAFRPGDKVAHVTAPEVCGLITYLMIDASTNIRYNVVFSGSENDRDCQPVELIPWDDRYGSESDN